MSRHWAADLIGRSHAGVGECWGLVREAWRRRWDEDLPMVNVGVRAPTVSNYRAIRRAAAIAHVSRARVARDGDVIVLSDARRLHVAMACQANGRLGLLESSHVMGVTWRPWAEAAEWATKIEVWGKRT